MIGAIGTTNIGASRLKKDIGKKKKKSKKRSKK